MLEEIHKSDQITPLVHIVEYHTYIYCIFHTYILYTYRNILYRTTLFKYIPYRTILHRPTLLKSTCFDISVSLCPDSDTGVVSTRQTCAACVGLHERSVIQVFAYLEKVRCECLFRWKKCDAGYCCAGVR